MGVHGSFLGWNFFQGPALSESCLGGTPLHIVQATLAQYYKIIVQMHSQRLATPGYYC